ncbi:MAG TPA: sulfurtransferase TusA family protein [Syntrophomonas sp.]|nr:sulfurtransferase TusA family protein [Syntrophomonas sp.]HRW13283.1 sulfurtransferase TusA family protein [Syntrophomonas sp.]
MEKVDVRGMSCPLPVIKTKKIMDQGANEILVTGSTAVSLENVSRLAKTRNYNINVKKADKNDWEIELVK